MLCLASAVGRAPVARCTSRLLVTPSSVMTTARRALATWQYPAAPTRLAAGPGASGIGNLPAGSAVHARGQPTWSPVATRTAARLAPAASLAARAVAAAWGVGAAAGATRALSSSRPSWPRFNADITAETIRVLDAQGEQVGILERAAALEYARSRGLDLVQFSDQNEPVVAKALDWHKERRLSRQRAAQRRAAAVEKAKNEKRVRVKAMRFTARIATHDLQVKVNKIAKMVAKGHSVKIAVAFQGLEPWKVQEVKRRQVLGQVMDLLGDTVIWQPQTLKVDRFNIHIVLKPDPSRSSKAVQNAAALRERLAEPIWPEAVAKADAIRISGREPPQAEESSGSDSSASETDIDEDSASE